MNIFQRIACVVGRHDWLLVSGSRKQTGYAVSDMIFMVHEMQEDEVCDCCRLRRTRFGLSPPFKSHELHPNEFRYVNDDPTNWPVDVDGNKLPSYVKEGKATTYAWTPKPKYHGKERDLSIKLVRRIW